MTTFDDVRAAQAGDRAAFGRLVRGFGPMALGVARRWLRDEAAAEDAAQDAFLDAFRRLEQLRAPEAFPAWLLRIVRKHCDRRTRAPRREVDAPGTEDASPVAHRVERNETRAVLLEALGQLPEHERIVVALHHLGEVPVREVAALLEIRPDAVKQRLRRGRARLRESIDAMDDLTKTELPTEALEDRVQLFLAIRSGDRDRAAAILHRRPHLANAREDWTDTTALAAGMTLAHRLTPLLTAVGRGDRAMVELLLARGADPNERCGCDAGESPLFSAAMRGDTAVVDRLLRAGANPEARAGGPSAVEVAQRRGFAEVATRLERSAAPPGPRADLAARIGEGRIDTGVAALDLLAPLAPGTAVRLHGAAETGLVVLLSELSLRLSMAGWPVRWVTWPTHPWQRGEYAQAARQYGLDGRVEVVEGFDRSRPGLTVLLQSDGREAAAEAALAEPVPPDGLLWVVSPWAQVTRGREAGPLPPPYRAQVVTEPGLAAEGIFPALDSVRSDSRSPVSERHARLREAVRAGAGRPAVRAAFRQPFEVYYPLTGEPGTFIEPEAGLDHFERALE